MTGMALDTPVVSTRFANDDDRWTAVARRDPAADGQDANEEDSAGS